MSISNLYHPDTKNPACRVLLVRHPESESNQLLHANPHTEDSELVAFKDPGITELGCRQMRRTAQHLANFFFQEDEIMVMASPQRRAYMMADEFLKQRSAPIHYQREGALYEYRRPGKGSLVVPHSDEELPEDTEWHTFVERVDRFRESLQVHTKDFNTIILFGHSCFFSALIHLCTTPGWRPSSVDQLAFHLPNASITHLAYNERQWSVLYQGSVAHLPEDERTGTHTPYY